MKLEPDIMTRITQTLGCDAQEIFDIEPLTLGLTNTSWRFCTPHGMFVYRRPGIGTADLIDRHAEKEALEVAKRLGLDTTYVAMDVDEGWKISRFIPQNRSVCAHDPRFISEAMMIAHTLHNEPIRLKRSFDFFEEGTRYEHLLREKATEGALDDAFKSTTRLNALLGDDGPEYHRLHQLANDLHSYLIAEGTTPCLSHNDFFNLNFIFREDGSLNLIDWEYAGMSDYASDYGTFVVCCQLSPEEARYALSCYFQRPPTAAEVRHNFAYVGFAGWCWYLWTLVKETEGEDVGEWKEIYHHYGAQYLTDALNRYRVADSFHEEQNDETPHKTQTVQERLQQ